jgi:transcriptional regulator with XRE-family HTH domain
MTWTLSTHPAHALSGRLPYVTRMAEIRAGSGLSQEAISRVLGVRVGQVSRWENGHGAPHPANRRKLAKLLNVQPDELEFTKGGAKPID